MTYIGCVRDDLSNARKARNANPSNLGFSLLVSKYESELAHATLAGIARSNGWIGDCCDSLTPDGFEAVQKAFDHTSRPMTFEEFQVLY